MNNKHTITYTLAQIRKPVEELYNLFSSCSIFTFTGTLGAGKTTLIKNLLRYAGIKEIILSPTFTYVIAYSNSKGETFYHFDLYRIGSLEEFIASGFDELLYSPRSWSFIEWPEVIMPLLTKKTCHVTIDYKGEKERVLTYVLPNDTKHNS